jgi:AraC-like DNA-binding protein/quercetin dioxygenase-like cupin family protein
MNPECRLDSCRRRNTLAPVRESKQSLGLQNLLAIAGRLKFQPHRIAHLLDEKGRHELKLPEGFPFVVSLFHFRAGAITQRLTWHQRLELLVPLDGPLSERMGERVVELQPGDVLVVDHLKPHQVVDVPGLDTRAVIISFLPECVFTPGAPPTDYAFLLPFHRKVEGSPRVVRTSSHRAGEAHDAIARLSAGYFDRRKHHREAGCKAWLLVLLNVLIQEFRGVEIDRAGLLKRQEQEARLKPVFDHVHEHYSGRISLRAAAKMCGMSDGTFGRVFKEVSGMTLGSYLNHVRMTHAVELLEETRESIAAIASRLGFSDQSHFDRRFRRTFGRTPSEHRAGLMARS